MVALTRMKLSRGVWEGILSVPRSDPPRLIVRHEDEVVAEPIAEPAEEAGRWWIRFQLPVERISDGVHTFAIEDSETGALLAHETLAAGEVFSDSLVAELSLLRAELDMLKRAFRRHCADHE